jgi:hypothetical protein
MKESDIQAEVEKRSQEGYAVSPTPKDNFTGQQLLLPKSTIVQQGRK